MNMATYTSPYIPPLQFARKESRTPSSSPDRCRRSSLKGRKAVPFRYPTHMTPLLTPQSSQETLTPHHEEQAPFFYNYLRAYYPFHPMYDDASSTITLPLNQGDIILVHSVHTNGWADGTLLTSGARGWLPTNYCEGYDHQAIRNLLKALTNFWDIVRGSTDGWGNAFSNQDSIRGLTAGVRFLLEKTECLNRESPTVQAHHGVRRTRKALLSELASLLKFAKRFEENASLCLAPRFLENDLDEMIMKAFKIITHGVRFLDLWDEDYALGQSIDASIAALDRLQEKSDVSPLKFAQNSISGCIVEEDKNANVSSNPNRDSIRSTTSANNSANPIDHREQTNTRPHYSRSSQTYIRPGTSQSTRQTSRPPSTQGELDSASHRVSYKISTLASEKLSRFYDTFLGFLGSFIGLHLQSRSSSELLITTQKSVESCRSLLYVVEEIWERDFHRSESLGEARDEMYNRLAELVHAARDASRPGQEDDVFMPTEGQRIVDAATKCVRGAGNCVAEARFAIERIGDFEFESQGLGFSTFDDLGTSSFTTAPIHQVDSGPTAFADKPLPPQPTTAPPPPPLEMAQSEGISDNIDTTKASIASCVAEESLSPITIIADMASESHQPSMETVLPPLQLLGRPLMSPEDYSLPSPIPSICSNEAVLPYSKGFNGDQIDVSSFGSGSTYIDSLHGDDSVAASQTSTRATSPDKMVAQQLSAYSLGNSFTGSLTTLSDECDEVEAKLQEKTFAHELIYNKDGQITGGTLPALIERLTTHGSTPDSMFVSTFYLTFRLFATPVQFAEALIDRFDYVGETPLIAGPVRLRVYNALKGWLESHWRNDCDTPALALILPFASQKLFPLLPTAGNRIAELAEKVTAANGALVPRLISSIGKTNTSIAQYIAPDTPVPNPIINSSQLKALRNWKNGSAQISILDFDALELARQFTLKESRIFCSILPEELLATEWMKKSGSMAVNVRAMSTLSTDLANLVADAILQPEEPKKRAVVIKRWIKIAGKCLKLNNYDSLMAIICSLNSSTILRLKRTWDVVSTKSKAKLENLKSIVDVSRNYAILRQRLQNHVPPCLPFVGTYLTDLTFVNVGNQAMRQLSNDGSEGSISVINFDKHVKTAKIISELQRFQIPYRLTEVPELQTWIQDQLVRVRSSDQSNVQNYYRRSLQLEPRELVPSARSSPTESRGSNASAEDFVKKEKFELWGWAHKEKQGGTYQTKANLSPSFS